MLNLTQANNKGADQNAHPRGLIGIFEFAAKIAEQSSLCLARPDRHTHVKAIYFEKHD